ncbi:flagellar biosynthesis anti-sigma factor FlgM [Campylobacter concisus]|uniref:Flagellar biosynthesis anti-sigma factor FlgM n=1 Tax=Campylobacter concisus TaxID=199 RepID=A0A7S9WZ69_9BACT|nr:flagellar biosynthesis anti-sigma factor FlgM [Campylobacter concisus]QPI05754.1 flagellar biosynthesis anti-sigma factor FlgM [Campylobacter concisus]
MNQRPNYQANMLNKNSDARVENENKEVKTNENARVKEIADAIANGTYQVDISKTAKAVADALL